MIIEASCRGTKCDCKLPGCGFDPPLEAIKYLLKFIFSFLRSSVEAKRGVELCHSTRNTFEKRRIRQKAVPSFITYVNKIYTHKRQA